MQVNKSPIEVPQYNEKSSKTCSEKCSYTFDYGSTDCIVSNNGDHLSLSYRDSGAKISYNGSSCAVQEVRLYKPSLNIYNGSKVDAELIINHTVSGGNNLVVCIPIVASDIATLSSSMMEPIIRLAPIKHSSDTTNVSINNYTLNNVVPSGPFFNYTGTLPYDDQNGTYEIIVFDMTNDSNRINISPTSLETLGTIIEPTTMSDNTIDTSDIYYNKKGTSNIPTDDEIYIDCQLLDSDGNVVVDETTGLPVNNTSESFGDYIKNIAENPWFDGIMIALVALGVIIAARRVLKN